MNLQPYSVVEGMPFSVSREDVLHARGRPMRQGRNGIGLEELDYDDVVFRFQDCGRLEEVTAEAAVLNLGNVCVPFPALERFVRDNDPATFDKAGFIISPAFGLAFDPHCPCWVTALARHCIVQWRAL